MLIKPVNAVKKLVKKLFGVEYASVDSYRRLFAYAKYSWQRVEYVDERRKESDGEDFKKQFSMKIKKGTISMSW